VLKSVRRRGFVSQEGVGQWPWQAQAAAPSTGLASATARVCGPWRQRQHEVGLIAFSDRPALSALTRPSLLRFAQAHPGRYELLLEQEPLLDARDFHPAWNKLAYAKRALLLGGFDVVVCFDDDVLITQPDKDPIFDAVATWFLPEGNGAKLVVASLDEHADARVPFNAGVLVLRRSHATLVLVDELFRIGRRLRLLNEHIWLPRISGLWDQDAFAEYIAEHGRSAFALLPHGELQSFVRWGHSRWRPGDFAAHFTGLADLDPSQRADLLAHFLWRGTD